MNNVLQEISKIGIVPVVKLDNSKDAAPLAKALCQGGLACAEITFRTAAAEESIKIMSTEFPEMLIGAGTVLTTEQVDKAINAGAKFIVSPGLNPRIVKCCIEKGVPVIPGCSSPSDIEQAIEFGLDVVKFFPAEAAGGINMIKSMSAPYVNMKFMPTGGINSKNLTTYLDFSKVIACGGSWMVSESLVEAGEFDKIIILTREAVTQMLDFEVKHIGINAVGENTAEQVASSFERMFGFVKNAGSSSIFAGTGIEVMKTPYLGKNGHIAVQTNYIERAIYHLEAQGFEFNRKTSKYDSKNNLAAIYIKGEIGGFAIHLVQKK